MISGSKCLRSQQKPCPVKWVPENCQNEDGQAAQRENLCLMSVQHRLIKVTFAQRLSKRTRPIGRLGRCVRERACHVSPPPPWPPLHRVPTVVLDNVRYLNQAFSLLRSLL